MPSFRTFFIISILTYISSLHVLGFSIRYPDFSKLHNLIGLIPGYGLPPKVTKWRSIMSYQRFLGFSYFSFWNRWCSLQSDWLSAVWFICELHNHICSKSRYLCSKPRRTVAPCFISHHFCFEYKMRCKSPFVSAFQQAIWSAHRQVLPYGSRSKARLLTST